MKKIFMALIIVNCYSCVSLPNSKLITPSKGVGKFILGEELKDVYNKEELEIKISKTNNTISEIIIKSSKFKTKEGFGVGTKFEKIKLKMGDTHLELKIKKGNISVGKIADGLFYRGIWFIDTNKDNITDGVWLVR